MQWMKDLTTSLAVPSLVGNGWTSAKAIFIGYWLRYSQSSYSGSSGAKRNYQKKYLKMNKIY